MAEESVTVYNNPLPDYPVLVDDVGGAACQIFKLSLAADGSGTPLTGTVPVSGTVAVSGTVTVSGTIAATQSGTWNINNISGTVSLPTGAATLAEQQLQTTALQLIDDAIYTTSPGKGILIGANNGGTVTAVACSSTGSMYVEQEFGDVWRTSLPGISSITRTFVADTASSTTLIAARATRKYFSIRNSSSATLYIRINGGTASPSDSDVEIRSGGYFESFYLVSQEVSGIWASDPNDGGALIVEYA